MSEEKIQHRFLGVQRLKPCLYVLSAGDNDARSFTRQSQSRQPTDAGDKNCGSGHLIFSGPDC
jgi:hypothetical protein